MRTDTWRWIWLLACAGAGEVACDAPPDPCASMCVAATELYGSCLETWEVDWESAGYEDADGFTESCETWAWTSRTLEEDVGRSGEVDAQCRSRRTQLESGTCDTFTDIDWSVLPWESPTDTGASG